MKATHRISSYLAVSHLLWTIISLALLSACSNRHAQSFAPASPLIRLQTAAPKNFGIRPQITPIEQIYDLNIKQRDAFVNFYYSGGIIQLKPYRRIFKYLQNYTQNYRFQEQTLTAEQTLATNQGNCLSLAILTTALAKIVSVRIGYQIVDSDPVYQQQGDIILASEHIQSLLFDATNNTSDNKGKERGIIVDYFPGANSRVRRQVSDRQFSALYYRNLAADAIITKDYSSAYWLLIETLKYNPIDEHAVNMMALVHERKGLKGHADKIYRQGIKYARNKLDLLRNYSLFLKKGQRFSDAKKIERQLSRINVINPFDWINLGHRAFSQKKYRESKKYYRKAIKMAPYIHQAYLGIAKSEYKLGNFKAARKSLFLAKTKAKDKATKSYYQAKLNRLSHST